MGLAGTKPCSQREPALAVERQQREVLLLVEITVPERQLLLTVSRIVGRVQINNDPRRFRAARFDERFNQKLIDGPDPLALRGLAFLFDRPFLHRQPLLPPRIGVFEP